MTAPERLDRLGLAGAGATAVAWGLVGTLVRAIPALTPRELVAGRLTFALVASVPLLGAPSVRRDVLAAMRAPAGWGLAVLLTTYYLVAVLAFRLAPVAEVALLIATAPLWALALRRVAGEPDDTRPQPAPPAREQHSGQARASRQGALVALAGVAVTLIPALRAGSAGAAPGPAGGHVAGDALALGAAALSAGYALTFRLAERRATAGGRAAPAPFGVAVLTFAAGCAALAADAAVRGEAFVRTGALDARGWALLALFGVVCTLVPTVAFATAARRLPPVLASGSLLLVPVVSAVAAAAVLGERPSAWLVPGGLLVVAGILRLLGVGARA